MGAETITTPVTAPGLVATNRGSTFFSLKPDEPSFFVGVSGPYTGLTFQVSGSRNKVAWYDVATFTSDNIGPLTGPVAPADGSSTAYMGDCRAFVFLQINVLTIQGSANFEVLFGGFFFGSGGGAQQSGGAAAVQTLTELRALRSVISAWLGFPAAQLIPVPPGAIGSGLGGGF